jgi:hypothetical protein
MASQNGSHEQSAFALRFRSRLNEGRGFAFPHDASDSMDLDKIGNSPRQNSTA